ncbi:hypothetical protein, partial [Limnobacter sp.]|uniref:hypothetical protein n=1 Tax=Limnobacter sp. TaxID=2003368 RepID=UPI00258D8929
ATLALKSGEWFLRGLRLMISPFLANIVDPKSSAVIFYPPVRISGARSKQRLITVTSSFKPFIGQPHH